MKLTATILLAGLLLAGCASTQTAKPEAAAVTATIVGYKMDAANRTVTFEFTPKYLERITGDQSQQTTKWSGAVSVKTVTIAGDFNGWDRQNWRMDPKGKGEFELTKTFADLGGKGLHQFKFVVDGDNWVEPPSFAANAQDAGMSNGSKNLTLEIP